MDDRKKKRSPKACLAQPAPAGTLRRLPLPASKSTSFALPLPHLPSPKQRAKLRRSVKEKGRVAAAGGSAGAALGAPLQHSFLTDVSDVCEMEGGLLNLLNDFHSGKLQAFGQLQSLRAEYEAVVREIEGDLDQLEWRGQYLLRPVFVEKVRAFARAVIPGKAGLQGGLGFRSLV
uniref:Coiled-coil domain containing 28B n=1 Tax=Dromaius novaehollandiae TaxID=8790 RepID=A0A8C4JW60_DRONO